MGMIIKVALGLVLGIFIIGFIAGPSSSPQKPGARVSQQQFTGGTRDTTLDRFDRDMKQINKNYNDCVADIRSGVSGVRNQSIACDRNAGRR